MSTELPATTPQPATDATNSEPARELKSRVAGKGDLLAIEALHDIAFGPGALTRTAYRVRERQPMVSPFCRVLYDGASLVASVRFTAVSIGGRSGALMLGPLAVAHAYANQGYGRRLIAEGLAAAEGAGIEIVVLVGDPPYYERFGFRRAALGQILMPGPVDQARLLIWQPADAHKALFTGPMTGAV